MRVEKSLIHCIYHIRDKGIKLAETFPKMLKSLLIFCLTILSLHSKSQEVKVTETPTPTSLRGLSVVTDDVVWISGSNGMVGRTLDGGYTWHWSQVKGFEKTDFRDIEAFDANTAVIMGIASPAYILRTDNGGKDWQIVFSDTSADMFLDAMFFWNDKSGMVIGDPIDNKFFIARTFDGGKTWQHIPKQNLPVATEGEALFAASGTNIGKFSNQEAIFVTGGKMKRLFKRNTAFVLPISDTSSTAGPNSIAIKSKKKMMIAGGDFMKRESNDFNCLISNDGGKTWITPVQPPSGYRSCIIYYRKQTWITCGLTGVDISTDEGLNWRPISTTGFHVVQKSKNGKAVFLAGSNKVGKIIF